MRILHVNKFLYRRGGAEAYMEDAAALMTAAGHDVAFWGMRHPENTHLDLADTYPEELELSPAPPGLRPKLTTAARMVWSRQAEHGIAEALDRFKPDVVHLHNIYHQLSPSVLRPIEARGVPAVMTLHDYKLACPNYQFLDHGTPCEACLGGDFTQPVRRRCKDGSLALSTLLAVETALHRRMQAYRRVSLFLCPSRFLLGKMVEAGVFPDRMRHVPNFVVDDAGSPAGDVNGPVVVASRLAPEKAVDVVVRAAGMLPPGREVVIAGDGPEDESLRRLADEVGAGRVRFAGRLAREETMRLLRGASVVVCASRWYENQPMVIIEAMAAGVPLVACDLGGISELVRPGVDGALVPPDDAVGLAAALAAVTADEDRWRRMSGAVRRRYEEDFSMAVHRERLTRAYEEAAVLAASGASR